MLAERFPEDSRARVSSGDVGGKMISEGAGCEDLNALGKKHHERNIAEPRAQIDQAKKQLERTDWDHVCKEQITFRVRDALFRLVHEQRLDLSLEICPVVIVDQMMGVIEQIKNISNQSRKGVKYARRQFN